MNDERNIQLQYLVRWATNENGLFDLTRIKAFKEREEITHIHQCATMKFSYRLDARKMESQE
jgi:hypothetical protein